MNDLSRPQLRLIIFYEWSCGTPAAETVTKIGSLWRDHHRTVHNDRCGRPTALNNDLLRAAVKERTDVTMRELETMLGCSHQTISNHLHDIGYRRVLARWVPHALSPYQMQTRVTACQSLLLTPQRKEFLADLVTGDESWVLYNNDTQRAVRIPRGHEPPVQPKANLHEKKCLLLCFYDAKSMLYYELLPQGRTVNATIIEKRPRRSAVHLLHDNASPHVAKAIQAKLQELNWETVRLPLNSPNIAPSDYHLFRPLKPFLKEKRFAKYEDHKMVVFDLFDTQPAAFWKKRTDDLRERWLTVVTNDGQYIVDSSC
uniref:Mos1 transposase HTH domain-containing protein n=1 Tax=Caenorhabditis japonica TaxID=281687 RepID=A0A8R1E651_CAEJA